MKKTVITLAIFSSFGILAQNNVGIGTLTPNPQAVLDIQSNDKGILISRLTTVSRTTLGTSLTGAEDGMLVYDKDLTTFFYWDGPNLLWVQVGSGTGDNWGVDVVNTLGTNIAGDGTPASPLVVTEVDGDITNEIQDLSLDPTTNILTITNNVAPTAINLSPFIDHDWYEVGGTTPADAITDDIYTQGNVGIGVLNPTTKLDIGGDLKVSLLTAGTSIDEVLVVDGTGLVKKIPALVPPGMVNAFAGTTAPTGYLICDGSAVSRTTYADLFAVTGTNYGVGDGATTFNLPDLRGEFIRGFDAGRGVDPTRGFGSNQLASPVVGDDNNTPNDYSMQVSGFSPQFFDNYDPAYAAIFFYYSTATSAYQIQSSPTGMLRGSRPRNVAMNYCIKF